MQKYKALCAVADAKRNKKTGMCIAYETGICIQTVMRVLRGKNATLYTFLKVAGNVGLPVRTDAEIAAAVKKHRCRIEQARWKTARLTGLCVDTIQQFENGRAGIRMYNLEKICDAIGLDLEELLMEA